jgi:hypothetical protein
MVLTTPAISEALEAVKTALLAKFTHGAVGTGTTAPTASDTTLTTETIRKTIQESFDAGDSITFSLFITTGEANAVTLAENGWFDDPSAGTCYHHGLLNETVAKTSLKELWCDTEIGINITQA